MQVRPQSQRLQILDLLHDLMFQHRQALKELGEEFIVGVTDLVSGEKDPRNLMIIFSVLKAVMIEWDISNHVEVGQLTVFEDSVLIPYSLCSMLFSATSRLPSDRHRMILMASLLKT